MTVKYHTEGFILDPRRHSLTKDGVEISVRPKTFSLLYLMLQFPGEVLSKQTIMDTIWDDVQVEEQVIVQSVRELRATFQTPNVIKTIPRKGYSWVGQVDLVKPSNETPSNTVPPKKALRKKIKHLTVAAMFTSLAIIGLTLSTYWQEGTQEAMHSQVNGSTLILPVKTSIQSVDHNWVYLGAMDQIISMIRGDKKNIARQTEIVLDLMRQAGLERNFRSEEVTKLFTLTDAHVVVETELSGNIEEYRLSYKLHFRSGVLHGLVSGKTIKETLFKLAKTLNQKLDISINTQHYESDFKNELMVRAFEYRNAREFNSAVGLFETLIALEPENALAKRKFAESLFYLGRLDEAENVLMNALEPNTMSKADEIPRLHYWLALVLYQKKQPQKALDHIEDVYTLGEKTDDWLYQGYASELKGRILADTVQYDPALLAYRQALYHYGDVHCPRGQSRTRLKIADIYLKQGNEQASKQEFERAEQLVGNYQIAATLPIYHKMKIRLGYE